MTCCAGGQTGTWRGGSRQTSVGKLRFSRRLRGDTDARSFCVVLQLRDFMQVCLGDNPYVRMTKDALGAECKICARPFCVFRWKPGSKARYKKTEVCQSCSKIKNCCQTCLLDLQYGLPLQVRDQFLAQNGATAVVPTSAVNREFFARQQEAIYASGGADAAAVVSDQLCRLARSDPYYRRNLPKICSFFLKGECTRGAECPYRHEQPPHEKDSKLASQNMKDRYYGVNDPVADKMMARAAERPKLTPPADVGICTLYATLPSFPVMQSRAYNAFVCAATAAALLPT